MRRVKTIKVSVVDQSQRKNSSLEESEVERPPQGITEPWEFMSLPGSPMKPMPTLTGFPVAEVLA